MTLDSRGYAALGSIYDAAMDPLRWREAIGAASHACGGIAGSLLVVEHEADPYKVEAVGGTYAAMPAEVLRHYVQRLAHLEAEQFRALSRQPARRVYLDDQDFDRNTLDQRADYRFLREKTGVGRRLGVRLNDNRAWYDTFVVAYDAGLPAIPPEALSRTEPLLPHLAKAVEMGRAFAQLRARYAAVLAVLDKVHVGLAIANARGEVIVANAEADRILGLADGVALNRNNRIVCRDPQQTRTLCAFIEEAARTAGGVADKPEGLIAVPRPSGAHPFLMEVAPLSDVAGEVETGLIGAVVTVIDPGNTPNLDIQKFGRLHGLTRAETSVCGYMVGGLTGPAIAEHRGTSPATVKEQMHAVLAKTGTVRRSELIRLVVRTLPPIG